MTERISRRGPAPMSPEDRREHCVSVRLNAAELAILDTKRGRYQRGEWLRMAALDKLPPSVPAINAKAWTELANAAANLNQIAKRLNQKHNTEDDAHFQAVCVGSIDDLWQQLHDFRRALIGASGGDE